MSYLEFPRLHLSEYDVNAVNRHIEFTLRCARALSQEGNIVPLDLVKRMNNQIHQHRLALAKLEERFQILDAPNSKNIAIIKEYACRLLFMENQLRIITKAQEKLPIEKVVYLPSSIGEFTDLKHKTDGMIEVKGEEHLDSGHFASVGTGYVTLDGQDRPALYKTLGVQFSKEVPVKSVKKHTRDWESEAGAMYVARHPNIINIQAYDAKEITSPTSTFDVKIFMEQGLCSLENALPSYRGDKPLRSEFLHHSPRYMLQLLQAIGYLHLLGVVHRDIKPQNLVVQNDETDRRRLNLKVIDFGLATIKDKAITAAGTPAYVAPEVIKTGYLVGSHTVRTKNDMWSIGATLLKLITESGIYPETTKSTGDMEDLFRAASTITQAYIEKVIKLALSRRDVQRFTTKETRKILEIILKNTLVIDLKKRASAAELIDMISPLVEDLESPDQDRGYSSSKAASSSN